VDSQQAAIKLMLKAWRIWQMRCRIEDHVHEECYPSEYDQCARAVDEAEDALSRNILRVLDGK
jgi:hypothetical protein